MRSLLVFAAAIAVTSGSLDWTDFRAGDVSLPTTEDDAVASNWKVVEKDSDLHLSWYSQDNDPRFLIAFDARKKCAGVRACFLHSDIDDAYLGTYKKSGIFEEGTYYGQKVHYSTVLFTPENILKNGGRRMLPTDEVAIGVYLKRHGKYKKLDRDGCENAKNPYVEQGCQQGYGLVFSKFGSKSKCDSMAPFYAIYDPEGSGNLIAFGWLSFSTFSVSDYATTTFYQTLPESRFKTLFPHVPACLSSYAKKSLTSLDVWLSYAAGKTTRCSSGSWLESHCQLSHVKRPEIGAGKDSSDESSES